MKQIVNERTLEELASSRGIWVGIGVKGGFSLKAFLYVFSFEPWKYPQQFLK